MVESAVRHGCVVVSVDLCELVRIDDETSLLSSTATEHEVASKVAGSVLKWLHASDARRLKDGTVITIQVNNLVFEGCWDASTRSVHLLEEKQGLPTLEQCSITLYEPAILLPALQPTQQHPACPEEYSVSFIASVSAPADVELVGWQDKKGASDVVEGSSRKEEVVLQVLAHARGMFLLVEVTEVSRADNGERTVQVCVARETWHEKRSLLFSWLCWVARALWWQGSAGQRTSVAEMQCAVVLDHKCAVLKGLAALTLPG
eukprot:1161438-Pelagomonas_calceolata.AAC.7